MRMVCCATSITDKFLFSTFNLYPVKPRVLIRGAGFAFLILISLVLLLREAEGDEFKITPSLSIKEEYDDNFFFTTENRTKDFITKVTPRIELINNTERLATSLLASINVLRYLRNNDLNDVEQNYMGRLSYSLHPKLKLSAEAGYTRDSTPDREIEVSGLVLSTVRRNRQKYAAGAEYTFSEKTSANLSYSYDQSDFKDPRFSDSIAHDTSLGFAHDLSQYLSATVGRMNLGYSRQEYPNSTVDYYYTTIGMSRAFSEKWNILINAGGSYSCSEFEVERLELNTNFFPIIFYRIVREQKKDKGEGWVGQATLSYNGEKTKGELAFNHSVMPALGMGGAAERYSLTINVSHRFTYELSGRLSTSYYINKSEMGKFSTAPLNQVTLSINPTIRYEFTKDIALEASYSYVSLKDKQSNTEAQRNVFMINFIIQYPLFE